MKNVVIIKTKQTQENEKLVEEPMPSLPKINFKIVIIM